MSNYWRGKNVLITGINGFIGGNLAKKLICENANVFGLIRNSTQSTLLYYEDLVKKITVIEGDLVEKDKIVLDAKVNGDIKAEDVETHSNSNIKGNIKSKVVSLGGKLKGNVSADRINIKKTANIEGVLNQKTLSIEEGATLKIKSETNK